MNRALVVITALSVLFGALSVTFAATRAQQSGPPWTIDTVPGDRLDVNEDGSIDLGRDSQFEFAAIVRRRLATQTAEAARASATPTSTSTPLTAGTSTSTATISSTTTPSSSTFTATITPTKTAIPTWTATPTTLADQLIATRPDHANPHSIVFNDPPLSYSWGRHGTEDTKQKGPLSWTLGSWYGVGQDKSVLNTAKPTVRFNIRRIAFWNYDNGVWTKMGDQLPRWYVVANPYGGSYSDDTPRTEPDGSLSFAIPAGKSLHGADGSWPWRHIDGGTGVIVLMEARLIGPPADIAALAGKLGANVGADYRDQYGTGGDSAPGYAQAGFGQITPLDGVWRSYFMVSTTMTDAQLRASGLPFP